ncbi:MAG TPA: aminotransferase class V-fold PLP-dependent enzyme, partial [Leptospiraceae bacterium]|nr:aminotransferase class V-fold PLP-dependent enzyme [Leptospiraceae bacterium]
GTIHDIELLAKKAHAVGALFSVDGAQGACHLPVDVRKIDCDFYSLSAHKMLGPTGVGVLYGKRKLLEGMDPFLGGGDMILTVQKDSYLPAELPMKFEAGTPNIAGVVAFAIALEYLRQAGLSNIHQHEQEIVRYAVEEMKRVQGVTLYGTSDFASRGGVVSFNVDGVHPHDVGSILDEEGIAVRAGHHCCEPFMRKLDISGTVRASFYLYNGPEDVDALIRGIKRVKEIFKK